MASFKITKSYELPKMEILKRINEAASKWHMDGIKKTPTVDGGTLEGRGLRADLKVLDNGHGSIIVIDVHIGFLLSPFRSQIESKINESLAEVLS